MSQMVASVAAAEHPTYAKYFKMLRMGISEEAVRSRMRVDGVANESVLSTPTEMTPMPVGTTTALDNNHRTLPWLVKVGDVAELIQRLSSEGAAAVVNETDRRGNTALIQASQNGRTDIALILLENGADTECMTYYSGDTAVMMSADNGYLDLVQLLLQHGAHVNAQNKLGRTALMHACAKGFDDITTTLLSQGADVDALDTTGKSALMCASIGGHTSIAVELIRRGAAVNGVTQRGETPLMFACGGGYTDTVAQLIASGGDVNQCDKFGDSPLHYAVVAGALGPTRMLITHHASLNASNLKGFSAIYEACKSNRIDLALLLASHGAELDMPSRTEETTLELLTNECEAAELLHVRTVYLRWSRRRELLLLSARLFCSPSQSEGALPSGAASAVSRVAHNKDLMTNIIRCL